MERQQPQQRALQSRTRPSVLAPRVVDEVLRSPGEPLDAQTRAYLEPRFQHDFSRVRVHADAGAAQSAQAIGARAWTLGPDIAFGSGMYAPWTPRGAGLLAHELAHVVQQRDAVRDLSTPTRGDADARYELAADAQAHAVAVDDTPHHLAPLPAQRIQPSLTSGLLDVVLFIPRLFGLEYFPAEDLKNYLDGLKKEKKPKNSLFSDNMARACVSREKELGPYDTPTKTLLVEETLQGWTSSRDEKSIITLLQRSEPERAQIVSAIGRERLWSKFGGANRRIIEAMTLTAADAGGPLVARLRKLEPAAIQDYASNTKDPAVRESVRRAMALSKITAPVPTEAKITEAGAADFVLNGVGVHVEPDKIVPSLGKRAFTHSDFHWFAPSPIAVTKENENSPVGDFSPLEIGVDIWTEFASDDAKSKPSGYGVGTRQQEVGTAAGTLRSHERAHGEAWLTFLRSEKPPVFRGTKEMLPAQYNVAVQQLKDELKAYGNRAIKFALKAGDCVGTLPTDEDLKDTGFTAAICHEH
jgi:hypothetical protein